MPRLSLLALALSAFLAVDFAVALRLPTTIRSHARAPSLRRRALGNLTDPVGNGPASEYSTNITVGGVPFTVILDTGSSDLWVLVNGTVPQSVDLGGAPINLTYGSGSALGSLHTATVEIEGTSIDNQVVLEVAPENSTTGVTGILGVGPPIQSNIFLTQNGSDATRPPLQRLFASNSVGPSFMTTAVLSRPTDPNEPFTGVFTINEIEHGFEAILNQPKLPVSAALVLEATQWTVAIEESALSINGVPLDLGKPAPLPPSLAGLGFQTPNLSALLDTGTTLVGIPLATAQQLYGSIPGAHFDAALGAFSVPCATEMNISITLSQQSYPIHPLDAVQSLPGQNGICIGGFTVLPGNVSESVGSPNVVLGDTFLRNVMMLNSWGGFVNQTVPADPKALLRPAPAFAAADTPYIQLLSLTDPSKAHLEFVATRGADAHADNGTIPSVSASGTAPTYAPSATAGATSATPGSTALVLLLVAFVTQHVLRSFF